MKIKIVLEFDATEMEQEEAPCLWNAMTNAPIRYVDALPRELFDFVSENLFDEGHVIQDYVEVVEVVRDGVSITENS